MAKELKITLVRSSIGSSASQKATLQALGLNKVGSSSVRTESDVMNGMIKKVAHLVEVK